LKKKGNVLVEAFGEGVVNLEVPTVSRFVAMCVLIVTFCVGSLAGRSPQQSTLIGMSTARPLVTVGLRIIKTNSNH
jgi:hypothetical protein